MLAVVYVTNVFDDELGNLSGNGISLREAIEAINTGTDIDGGSHTGTFGVNDEIQFDASLFTGNTPRTIELNAAAGELSLLKAIKITGPGASLLTIDAGNGTDTEFNTGDGFRIFNIDDYDYNTNFLVTLTDLTLTGGDSADNGGAINSYESLSVVDSVISGNASAGVGGGIYAAQAGESSSVTIDRVTLSENWAEGGAGAISASGDVKITDSFISENYGVSAGGIYLDVNSTLVILNSQIDSNEATNNGGGIFIAEDTNTTITKSQITNNHAGSMETNGYGGGIYAISTPFTELHLLVDRTLIDGNVAQRGAGGGIFYQNDANSGSLEIQESRISNNVSNDNDPYTDPDLHPHDGGGGVMVYAGEGVQILIANSTIDHNRSYGKGGGIDLGSALATIENTTISTNEAMEGGGVWAANALIRHSTITLNRAGIPQQVIATENYPKTSGGGGLNIGGLGGGQTAGTVLDHTIIAGNFHDWDEEQEWLDIRDNNDRDDYISPDIGFQYGGLIDDDPAILTANYSIIGTTAGALNESYDFDSDVDLILSGTGDLINVDAQLGPLTNNGGPDLAAGASLFTHLPQQGSPAIDAGDPLLVQGVGPTPRFDERGPDFDRIFGSKIDIGAVERQPFDPHCSLIGDYNRDGVVDAGDYVVWRKYFGTDYDLFNEDPTATPGKVTEEDYDVWRAHYGDTCPATGTGQSILMVTTTSAQPHNIFNVPVATTSSTTVGGLLVTGSNTTALLKNSIVAGNRQHNDSDSDILLEDGASFDSDSGHNLIGFDSYTGNNIDQGVNGNIVGGEGMNPAIDPRLAPLGNYGGRTKTHALLFDSLAIDAGDNDVVDDLGLLSDQRGQDFHRIVDGGFDLDNVIDMGAFELALSEIYSV